ncbi:unnamed protein product, partial [Notodromas monacha]
MIRGSNKLVLEEAERSLHDALCVIRCLVKKRAMIAGGGAPETEISVHLAEYAQTVAGIQSYCIRAFAEAMEVIPFTLAENAGLNPIATVTELRNRHAKGETSAGINVRKASDLNGKYGTVTNILEENVVQPLLVSTSAISIKWRLWDNYQDPRKHLVQGSHGGLGGSQMQDERECAYCDDKSVFKSRAEFMQHLRSSHCSREGGSYVCKYGYNGVCASLPVEGVDDKDYEQHVCKQHLGPDSSFANSRRRSSVLSLSGTATGSTRSWTLYSASQNLATVLNDPNRGKQKDLFTKTWGESFVEKTMVSPSPLLEPVTIMDLAPYLRKNSKRYRKLLKRKALFSPNVSAKPTAVPATSDHVDLPKVDQLVQIFPKLSSLKVHENVIGDLNSIPEIFHGSDFDLSRLDQFERVFPENRNASKLVQEQLSHYLDMVEINIAAQIAQNSEAYFKTMSCHDVLMADLNTTTSKVRVLRAEMSRLRKTLVEGPMQIIALFQQRSRAAVLLKTLKVMRTVHQTQGTVQLLLATSDFVGALDLIATTHDVLEENLKNLRCFRYV